MKPSRRRLLVLLATGASVPAGLLAQTAISAKRIGFLNASSLEGAQHHHAALREELRALGWVEGRNLALDFRHARGDPSRYEALARELIAQKPDLLLTGIEQSAKVLAAQTSTIPILFVLGFDPLSSGLVQSLAHPGGNVTGLSMLSWELTQKRLSLLREVLPKLSNVGLIHRSETPGAQKVVARTIEQAHALRVHVVPAAIRGTDDIEAAFLNMAKSRCEAVMNVPDALLFTARQQLVDLALKHRMVSCYGALEYADAGGFMAYAANFVQAYRRAAHLADRLLRGASPATTPVEQPNVYELVVNLKTAKALRLKLPQSLLLQATRVIE